MWTPALRPRGTVPSAPVTMCRNATVAAAQFEPAVGDVGHNLDRIDRLAADLEDADVVVFPELCVTGYDLDVARTAAAPVPGALTAPLVGVAAERGVDVVVGLPERDGDALYNALVYVDGDGVRATYRKRYLWGDERETFDAGSGPVTVDTDAGRVGFLVCYDLNLPEASLEYARRECDVLAVAAAWRTSYRRDWRLLLRARALDGTCYAVGSQAGREHAGTSLVAEPTGRVAAEAAGTATALERDVSEEALRAARERNPVFETRRGRE